MGKNNREELFDRAFQEALRSELDMEVPDPVGSWKKVQPRIRKRARMRRIRQRLKLAVLAAAAMAIGVLLFGRPQETEAFHPVSKFLSGVKGGVITLFQGDQRKLDKKDRNGMKTDKPPEDEAVSGAVLPKDDNSIVESLHPKTVEEARKLIHSQLFVPDYIPEGYVLQDFQLRLNADKKLVASYQLYSKPVGGQSFYVNVVPVSMDQLSNYKMSPDEKLERVRVGGNEAITISETEGDRQLFWGNGMFSFRITGPLTSDEIVHIAESMK